MGLRHVSEVELTEYADGELDPTRLGAVTEHVSRCPLCARSLADIREAATAAGGLSYVAAPADLRARAAKALLAGPAGSISCKLATPRLHEYLDGCLSPAAAVPLKHHLDSCLRCRAELAVFASASRLVRALPDVDSPACIRESVLAEQRRRSRRTPAVLGWRPALAAAAAMVALGALAFLRHSPQPEVRPLVARAPAAAEMSSPGPVDVASLSPKAAPPDSAQEVVVGGPEEVVVQAGETAELEAAPRAVPAIRPVDHALKGPVPARVTPEVNPPEVALPAALGALRVVARNAADDGDVQRAMELAGERFAVLHSEALSEATLVRMSVAGPEAVREERGISHGAPPPSPGGVETREETGGGPSKPSSAPAREGAGILPNPFV
ncbi:MAG TPA: anti-sigma factor [Armatimonadota bacterium]|nr:anti-sigma factor [Armatimonadota bacterium]